MCIIAVYEHGKRPDKETVKIMMENNGDGAGLAWINRAGRVEVHKGYTTAEDVMRTVKDIPDGSPILFHARIATSGGVSAEKCHPYPLTDKDKFLNAIDFTTSVPVIAHNGVLPIDIDAGLNDSQTFIKKYLYPIITRSPRAFKRGKLDCIINRLVNGSRLAIITPAGIKTYGTGWETHDGIKYSNGNYKRYTYYSGNAYKWYNDYDKYWGDYDDWYYDREKKTWKRKGGEKCNIKS